MNSYVINLKRRNDRLDKFKKYYNFKIPLTVVEAVDGLTELVDNKHISNDSNEYQNNLCIKATIASHVKVWTLIANGTSEYGLVFEDDVLFSHYCESFDPKELKYLDKNSIVYLGTGDLLPILTNPPSESMLRAQERSHAIKVAGLRNFGRINMKSIYVFDWLGAFSYLISKDTAKNLLILAERSPISKAVDVWLKENLFSKYVHIPLLTWHPNLSADNYDSDITPKNPVLTNVPNISQETRSALWSCDMCGEYCYNSLNVEHVDLEILNPREKIAIEKIKNGMKVRYKQTLECPNYPCKHIVEFEDGTIEELTFDHYLRWQLHTYPDGDPRKYQQ